MALLEKRDYMTYRSIFVEMTGNSPKNGTIPLKTGRLVTLPYVHFRRITHSEEKIISQ
jgi:hypothetical protein